MTTPLGRTAAALLAAILLLLGLTVRSGSAAEQTTPLARAHAHNDYEHDRPLFDALGHGFKSVEADIWLVDGRLLVAHDLVDVDPDRTLENLYLDPLAQVVRRNRGSVYRGDPHYFQLLIDIKSDGESTYRVLHSVLRRYRPILTKFHGDKVEEGAVTAVVSGDRPRELMESQRIRFAAYDGRLSDLDSGAPAGFMPLISDRWTAHFTWLGVGPMPEPERAKLRDIVTKAHEDGRRLRFWETPDIASPARDNVWGVLLEEQVDYINTDDLAGLQEFLLENDPEPSKPYVTFESSRP